MTADTVLLPGRLCAGTPDGTAAAGIDGKALAANVALLHGAARPGW